MDSVKWGVTNLSMPLRPEPLMAPRSMRKRAERALTSMVANCNLLGLSTRRVETLVQSLGVISPSRSQVSWMAKEP